MIRLALSSVTLITCHFFSHVFIQIITPTTMGYHCGYPAGISLTDEDSSAVQWWERGVACCPCPSTLTIWYSSNWNMGYKKRPDATSDIILSIFPAEAINLLVRWLIVGPNSALATTGGGGGGRGRVMRGRTGFAGSRAARFHKFKDFDPKLKPRLGFSPNEICLIGVQLFLV